MAPFFPGSMPTNSFNPWYVGGGVKRVSFRRHNLYFRGFNPWYVGGGVKRRMSQNLSKLIGIVSILGMLEGVLKAPAGPSSASPLSVSILGMLEGVLKEFRDALEDVSGFRFQSLVCWRGC